MTRITADEIAAIYQAQSRKVLATLIRLLGDFDVAEDAVAEAFRIAAQQWPCDGLPDNPGAWLVSTGRFRGIDMLRRRGRGTELLRELGAQRDGGEQSASDPAAAAETATLAWTGAHDDQLRLLFTCCHPALPIESRVALALREVCGLRTDEIARCYFVSPDAMKRRLSRAKALIRDKQIPYQIPSETELGPRLSAVLHVIYLVFNEGYAATSGEQHIRHELTREALSLARHVVELMPEPEALGLLALLLLHQSRSSARVDGHGDIVPLEEQNRTRWDRSAIAEAQLVLQRAFMSGRVGPYTLQAAIASVHADAPSVDATNWVLIVEYYDLLLQLMPGPVVELQRAIAVAMRDGPAAGMALVDRLAQHEALAGSHTVHAVRADLARRLGDHRTARTAYQRAIELVRQEPERRFLMRRLENLPK